jgi:predicted nuclease of predicted toxin-antitoxin system
VRILADENLPRPLIDALRERGHDVLSAVESLSGMTDQAIVVRATAEGRIIFTFDKDFGELAVRFRAVGHAGVVLFRLSGASPEEDNARALASIESRNDWEGHFSVVTDNRIRMRKL